MLNALRKQARRRKVKVDVVSHREIAQKEHREVSEDLFLHPSSSLHRRPRANTTSSSKRLIGRRTHLFPPCSPCRSFIVDTLKQRASSNQVKMPPSTHKIENAKSGRSKCKRCKELIANGTLRIVTEAYSETRDMDFVSNFHTHCFKVPPRAMKGVSPTTFVDEHLE